MQSAELTLDLTKPLGIGSAPQDGSNGAMGRAVKAPVKH